ncbi:hypothetical protein ASC98_27670 [Rhizobacter sp. Root1238]|nr:hypothetical protein ASC88_12915 [Rhizobacter sp. Root29]KQW03398.1 hypothetical protein ASC98_27670 [Rhizobacter sp. Root1238]
MTHLQVLIIATLTWIVWMPASSLQRLASEGRSSISILPIFAGAPLAVWGLAYVLPPPGATVIGAIHLGLLIWMMISIARSRP